MRIACGEVGRRAPRLRISGPELDDLAYKAAPDALLAITANIGQFQGEGRFTTGAYKFLIFEVSAKIGRHFGGTRACRWTPRTGSGCRDRLSFGPAQELEWRDLLAALRCAVDEELTPRRREFSSRW